ncbi:MAG: PilZ domain-containing protein [Solirubrobacterales bacterium]
MVAAGAMVDVGIVTAGVIVVLAAIWLAGRRSTTRRSEAPPVDPFAQPVVHHVGADRRRLTRAPLARPVVVRRDNGEQRTFALDISSGGILLAGPADLAIGEVLDVSVDLDELLADAAGWSARRRTAARASRSRSWATTIAPASKRYVTAGQPGS